MIHKFYLWIYTQKKCKPISQKNVGIIHSSGKVKIDPDVHQMVNGISIQ